MGIKISDMVEDTSVGGAEMIPVSDGGLPKRTSPAALAAYTVDQIEAITAATSVSGSDSVFVLQGGALKPADIDLVSQYGIDTMWGKAAITTLDNADVMLVKDGGATEKTVTMANVATYVLSTIQSSLLNFSTLSDGSGTLASGDYLCVTQGTTPKRVTVANVTTMVYSGLSAHVAAKDAVVDTNDADVFYVIQGGTAKKVTLAQIVAHSGSPVGGTGTVDYLAQWSGASTLKAGYSVVTSISSGANTSVPTSKAVADAITAATGTIGAAVRSLTSQVLNRSAFVDDGGLFGHIDFSENLPAGAMVIGVRFDVITGFTGNVAAMAMVGDSSDGDRFLAAGGGGSGLSVFAAGSVGATPQDDGVLHPNPFCATSVTPRVSVAGSSDFGLVSAGSMTCTIYYLETE